MLHALSSSHLPEAQRLAATLLAPLAETHTTLRPLLQQTMQWFLQTDQTAVQDCLACEKASAMLSLSSHFSGLCSPAKRAAPDPIVGPAPPQPASLRAEDGASPAGGASGSGTTEAGPSTSAAVAPDSQVQGAAAEDAETAALHQSQLVNLLQAGVFVYASWCRRTSARRHRAVSDPCGAALGMHSLLHGGLEAAIAVIQAVDGNEQGAGAGGDVPGGATRTRMLADWGAPRVRRRSVDTHVVLYQPLRLVLLHWQAVQFVYFRSTV